jgi:hypothetical protein
VSNKKNASGSRIAELRQEKKRKRITTIRETK